MIELDIQNKNKQISQGGSCENSNSKKVISFCLYGSKATYIIGMKENIILAKKFYPDWLVYIYYNDTVPEKYIKQYQELGANCILCENIGKNKMNWEGMFWRWFPLDESDVSIWLSRDADSRLSEREAKLVNEWETSGKTLHSIRDHRCHMHCIMGGLFGINNSLFYQKYKFKKVKTIIQELHGYYRERPYNVDQIFLNDNLWKILKDDVMAHISNQGRKVYDTDISIPYSPDFIGKQYRLDDFPENIIKNLDKNKGCYWKTSTNPSVYWSNSSTDIKRDIKFSSQDDYYIHRVENGYPQNWSQINIFDGIDEDSSNSSNSLETNPQRENKGCYWKQPHNSSVYWSNSSTDIKRDIKFSNPGEYFDHRVENGFPKDWSKIKVLDGINTEDVQEKPGTTSLHKIRIVDYNKVDNTYLPYKCDWNYANYKLIGDETKQPKTIFIKVEFIEAFYNSYYKKIEKDTKFIIISGGGDATTPNNIDVRYKNLKMIENNKLIISEILKDDRLIHWYAENCDELLDKLSAIPTGVINNNNLNKFYNSQLTLKKQINFNNKINVLCCHRVRDFTPLRKKVDELCNNEWKSIVTHKKSILQDKFLDEISKYTFMLCVQGGGLDPSPKAFEAIIAGVIPIIKKSDGVYSAYKDLPVVFIDDWIPSEITENKLNNWLATMRKYYEDEKLRKETLYKLSDEYWWKYINNSNLCVNKPYKNVYILDTQEKKFSPIVKALFTDLMGGFVRLGFNVKTEVNSIDDIDDYSLVFIDNSITNDMIDNLYLKNKNCIFFGWCCHERKDLVDRLNKLNFVFVTTETLTPRGKQLELVKNTVNYCPLYHRSDEDPNKIGTFKRNNKYDWCYTGWKYKDNLIPTKFKGLNKGVKSHKDYLTSEERREVYLSSLIHLAYVGDTNIVDGATPQRIFEGLSYGCIVLTNSKPACQQTENIPEYVGSLKDVEEKITYYLNNPDEVVKKQQLAYEFVKKSGTNHFTIEKMALKSKQLFDIDFLENMKINLDDQNPLVSIAISTYESGGRGHELLKHNLDHILKQDYSNIEIVISDHSSDNKIKDLCQQYDGKNYHNGSICRIKYIHNPDHKGNSSQNTNNAIEYCNGEYIKILFMDDYLYNESAISIIVKKMQENPDKKWLVHSYKHTKNYKDFYNLHHPKFSHDMIFCNRIGCPSCLTIHKSVTERFDEKLKWFMDSELYSRLRSNYHDPIILHTSDSEKPLMINLHHDGQVSNTSINNELINEEKTYIRNKSK